MKLFKRYDYQPNTSTAEFTPEGFLRVSARAARVGVLKYRQDDGKILRELVPADELFNADSMATLAMKPITNDHPVSLLDSESASAHMVGMTGETVKQDEDFLFVSTVITDKDTIDDAEGGKVEVSPGYVCELDFTPGTFNGEHYDAVQRNRRYNHLAVVKKGRNGPEVRLRLDSDDAIQVELSKQKEEIKKVKLNLDGKEYEVADDVGAAFNAAMEKAKCGDKGKMDSLTTELATVKAETDKLQAKCDGFESEVTKLKKVRTDSAPAEIQKAVKARIALEKVAASAGVEKFDAMEDMDLKKAVIKTDSPETNLEGKSEEYINARFDVAAEAIAASDETAKKIGGDLNKRKPTEVMDADDARQKMIERNQSAWKKERKES